MRVKLFCLFVIQLILLALITTNPSLEKHKEFARIDLLTDFEKPTPYIQELVKVVVDEKIFLDDYWLFSLTKFDDLGTMKTIGIGIFDTVVPFECVVEHKPFIIMTIVALFILIGFVSKKVNL